MANRIGWWTFDNTTEDSSSVGNDATLVDNASYDGIEAGDDRLELELDGDKDYASIVDNAAYATDSATIAVSFNFDTDGGKQVLVSQGEDEKADGSFRIFTDGKDKITVRVADGNAYKEYTAALPNDLLVNQQYEVIVAFDDATDSIKVYLDSVEVLNENTSSDNVDFRFGASSDPIVVGAWKSGPNVDDTNDEFDGELDFVELWDEALSPSEVMEAREAAETNTIHDLTDGSDQGEIIGTDGDDTMFGGPGTGQADGGAVIDDTMEGGGGNDTINAGDGDDIVAGGLGDDTISGGSGDDTLYGDGDIPGTVTEAKDVGSLVMSPTNIRAGSGTNGDPTNAGDGTSVIYENAGFIDGNPIALRLTLVEKSDPNLQVNLTYNDPDDRAILLDGGTGLQGALANFKVEFLDQTTLEQVVLNGKATFSDLDDNSSGAGRFEQLVLDSGSFVSYGVDTNTSLSVEQSPGSVTVTGSESNSNSDEDAWFSANFEGKTEINFQLVYPGQQAAYGFNGADIAAEVVIPVIGGDDVIDGGEGNDTIFGDGGDDLLLGGADDDTIDGGTGDDQIYGGTGDDTLAGGEGADRIDGGAGDDIINAADDDAVAGGGYTGGGSPQQVGQWPFDNFDPLDDNAAIDNDAELVAGATPNGNGGVTLDGIEDYVRIPHDTDYDLDSVTVKLDFVADDTFGIQGLFSRDSTNLDGGGHFTAWVEDSGALKVRWQSDTESYFVTAPAGAITAGTEHELVVKLDADTNSFEVFLDGTSVGSNTVPVSDPISLSGNVEPWVLGASQNVSGDGTDAGTTEFLNGTINHFEIWDTALDPDEIDALSTGDIVIGGEGSDVITANGGDTVLGDEDPDGKDVDVLVVNDVASIEYRDENGDITSDVTETGVVTFNDGTTLAFSEIENFVVDGAEFTSSDTKPTIDLDFQGGTTPPGPGEAGSEFIALDPATAPVITNNGLNLTDDGVAETARYENVATVDGKSVDLIAVVVDSYKIDASGDTGASADPTFNVKSPDGNTANLGFDGNSYHKVTWKVVEAGTDTPVNGNFSLLLNDLDGNSGLTSFERVSVAKDDLDSYALDGNTDLVKIETADKITFQPSSNDPGVPGALPENSVQLTFTNTSEFTIEYEKLNTGGNVGLDGEFSSSFFTDPEVVDTNPDFGNIYTEGGSPVVIAASNSNVDSQGACLKELSIKPVDGTFPDGADETLTFPGDVANITIPLDGSDNTAYILTTGGKDYTVQFNATSGEIEVKPLSEDEVEDGDMEAILESIVYENAADIDGVSPIVRELDVTVTDIYGTESDPATASITVVGTDEKLFDLINLDGPVPGVGEEIFSGSEMTAVKGPYSVAQDDPSKLTLGDTIVVSGNTLTLTSIQTTDDANLTLEDGTELSDQQVSILTFSQPGGVTLTFIAPEDVEGDRPEITKFSYDSPLSSVNDTPIDTLDTDDIVTLGTPNGPEIFDAIQLSGSVPATSDEQTTADGDLVAVDEPLQVVGQSTPGAVSVGDTIKVGDDFYTVSGLGTAKATIDHDDQFGIPTTSTNVDVQGIQLTADDGGPGLTYFVPVDDEGDLPEITSITLTSPYAAVPSHTLSDPDDNDIGSDDVVTLDGAENNTIVTDLIILDLPDNGNPGAGSVPALNDVLSTAGGQLVDVVNAASVTHGAFGTDDLIESGDIITINGIDYTIDDVQEVVATVSHDDPATGLPVVTTGVEMHNIVLINDSGDFLTVAVPTDGDDLPQITQIEVTAVNGAGDEIADTEVDDDDVVTLDTDEVTIHDAIVTAPGVPETGNVFTTGSNDLTSVEEPISVSLSPGGEIEPGATFTIGGEVYEVTTTKEATADVTFDNGTSIQTNQPVYIIEGTSADGETVTFTVPQDGTALPNITSIEYVDVGVPDDTQIPVIDVNGNGNVTLGTPGPQIFDAIELSDPALPDTGDLLTTEGGSGIGGESPSDFVKVSEPITVGTQDDPTLLQPGDTLIVGGQELDITNIFTAPVDYVLDSGPVDAVPTIFVQVKSPDGESTIYALPNDSEGALPDIQSMQVGLLTPVDEVPFGDVDTDDNVTLDPPAGVVPGTFVLHDFVQIDGQPTEGEIKTVLDDELVEVDEPIVFTTAQPDEIDVGDTTVIGGVPYTVTQTGQWTGTVTLDDGSTPTVSGGLLTLDDGAGGTITYAMPYDQFGDLPDITQIAFTTLDDDPNPEIQQVNIDDNDYVTLICFAAGTNILTNKGEVEVQNLAIGDKVLTRDNGYQKIKWIGKTKVAGRGKFAPVVIEKGTFGNDRDLVVSPQHRVLVCDWRAELMFGEFEVLVPAKHLTTTEGVYTDPRDEVEYVHVLFDQHEVIFSEGIPTESFHPGDYSVKGLADETREELFELFPELAKEGFDYGPSARLSLKRREATQLIEEMGLRPVVMH